MIEINLFPLEFRRKEAKAFKLPELPYLRIGAIIIAALVGVEALLFGGLLWTKAASRSLESEIRVLGPDFERIKALRLDKARKETNAAALDKMMKRPFSWTLLMNAVSDSLVDTLWLTEISVERKMFEFEIKAAPPKPPKKGAKSVKGAKPVKDAKDDAPAKKPSRIRGPQMAKRYEYFLVIQGSAPVASRTTAAVGQFIQSLEENQIIRGAVENVKLEKIDRMEDHSGAMRYVFTIRSKMKPAYGEDRADKDS